MNKLIEKYNSDILDFASLYLNKYEKLITKEQIDQVTACGVSEIEAYKLLLINYFDIQDKKFVDLYFHDMLHAINQEDYIQDKYYQNIQFNSINYNEWSLRYATYSPYELFVQDDFIYKEDGRVIPNLAFFNKTFRYPAVYQRGRLWMSVTPNEINTMKEPILRASGKVVTFGLGLGYFAYMCSNKDTVNKVTIVEKDQNIITLFKKYILPQFDHADKINIICQDAYEFLDNMKFDEYDYLFVDIYHDASDGMITYSKIKPYEQRFKHTKFDYWIEKTIKYYLD